MQKLVRFASALAITIALGAAINSSPARAAHRCGGTVHIGYGAGYSGFVVSHMSCKSAYKVARAYRSSRKRPYGYRIRFSGYTMHGHKGSRRFRASMFGTD